MRRGDKDTDKAGPGCRGKTSGQEGSRVSRREVASGLGVIGVGIRGYRCWD